MILEDVAHNWHVGRVHDVHVSNLMCSVCHERVCADVLSTNYLCIAVFISLVLIDIHVSVELQDGWIKAEGSLAWNIESRELD